MFDEEQGFTLNDLGRRLANVIRIGTIFEIETRKSDIIKLKSTEIDSSTSGSKIYGAVRLTYSVTYRTAVKQPLDEGILPTEINTNL